EPPIIAHSEPRFLVSLTRLFTGNSHSLGGGYHRRHASPFDHASQASCGDRRVRRSIPHLGIAWVIDRPIRTNEPNFKGDVQHANLTQTHQPAVVTRGARGTLDECPRRRPRVSPG